MDIEKDQLKDKIKKLYENMLNFGNVVFIIVILDEDMEYVYDFVKFIVLNMDDIKFINFLKSLIIGDWI